MKYRKTIFLLFLALCNGYIIGTIHSQPSIHISEGITFTNLKAKIKGAETITIFNGGSIICESGDCIINSKLIIETNQQIFFGKGRFIFGVGAVSFLNPKSFGAKGNGSDDDADAIQKCVESTIYSDGVSRVLFDGGSYRISRPIIVAKKNKSTYDFFNVTIEGAQSPFDVTPFGNVVVIKPDFDVGFVFGLQSCRSVIITNISFKGKNDFNYNLQQVYETDFSKFGRSVLRNDRYSPYSAIVIDPFHNRTDKNLIYPGLDQHYRLEAPGSSAVKIQNCRMTNFDVGITISPNGFSTQGDNVRIDDCFIDHCKVGMAICQSQSRTIQVNNLSATHIAIIFDASTYGAQQGQLPEVNVGSFGIIKWIFKCSNGFAYGHFKNLYTEEVYGLGFSTNPYGVMPVNFSQCVFHFSASDPLTIAHKSTKSNPALLQGFSASFDGCFIGYDCDINKPNILNFDVVNLSFNNCTIDLPVSNSNLDRHSKLHNTIYQNVTFRVIKSDGPVSNNTTLFNIPDNNISNYILAAGQNLKTSQNTSYLNNSNGCDFYKLDDRVNLKIDQNNLTASFKSSISGIYGVGDQIFIDDVNGYTGIGNTVRTCVGIVKEVKNSIVILSSIVYGLKEGNYTTYCTRLPYLKARTIGKTIKGSNVIDNVIVEGNIKEVWYPGDKIKGISLLEGTEVVSVEKTKIIISHPALESFQGDVFYDADVTKILKNSKRPTSGVWKKGDEVLNDFSIDKKIYKWVCVNSGSIGNKILPEFKAMPFSD